MTVLFIIIWLLLGIIAVWRDYHGTLKEWYHNHKESYWKFDKKNNNVSAIRTIVNTSPLLIIGGLISLLISESINTTTWWFTTKNK
jgi:hypothetical protein